MAKQTKIEEQDKKVVVSPEDSNSALNFWPHFKVPLSEELKKSVEVFSKDPTFENQELMKLEFCKAICGTEHEAFTDEMFVKVSEECKAIAYDMLFDESLEKTLTVETEKK
jgi:hypothetical protein